MLGSGSGGGFAGGHFRAGNLDLIFWLGSGSSFIFNLGGYLARSLLLAGIVLDRRLCSDTGQLAAVSIPVGRLSNNDFSGFALGNALNRAFVRNRKNFAGFQAVHVAAVKGLLIGTKQPDQHLVK